MLVKNKLKMHFNPNYYVTKKNYPQMIPVSHIGPYPQMIPVSHIGPYPQMIPVSHIGPYPQMIPVSHIGPYPQMIHISQVDPFIQEIPVHCVNNDTHNHHSFKPKFVVPIEPKQKKDIFKYCTYCAKMRFFHKYHIGWRCKKCNK
jgi:hypothetical protein